MSAGLWTVQGPLALLFLYSGVTKFMAPSDDMISQVPLPALLVQIAAVLELLGGLGLLLPGLLRLGTILTPLAAAVLSIQMGGATVIGLFLGDPVSAMMPMVAGLLAAFVGYGRWQLVPHVTPPAQRMLQAAN